MKTKLEELTDNYNKSRIKLRLMVLGFIREHGDDRDLLYVDELTEELSILDTARALYKIDKEALEDYSTEEVSE